MTGVPDPWEAVLLALGTFRLVRLIGWDTITEGLRERITGLTDEQAAEWASSETGPIAVAEHEGEQRWYWRPAWRKHLSTLIRCPWCQGFYVSAAVWALWALLGDPVLVACVPLALSAAVGLTAKNLDP